VLLSAMSSAVTADVVSKLFVGMHSTFSAAPVQVMPISYYLSLLAFGALLGLFGAFYNRILLFSQTLYGKIHWSEPVKMMIPFAFAGLFGLTLPQVLGGGHSMIEALLHGEYALGLVAVLLIAKFVFSMISYGSGAPGGIFFPLLVLGALGGALFGRLAILCGVVPETYAVNFMLLGMAGMFTAIVRAPLTGIILIVEMSGSLTQLLSLSVVCLCAYIAADLCHSAPIYESLLDRIKPARYQAAHPEERIFLDLTVQFGSFVCRKKIEQVHWPKDCLITNIVRGRETLIPHGDTVILPGDMLTILCKSEDEVPLRRKLSKSLEN
ncbi:MAG: chloride channel protein, partial [Acutalibacteraceae bacterium]